MCEHRIGSVPVVIDQKSRELVGMITDRDLCCSIIAAGLDPNTPLSRNSLAWIPSPAEKEKTSWRTGPTIFPLRPANPTPSSDAAP